MDGILGFLASVTGRWVRLIAGLVLVLLGVWLVKGVWSWVLIIVGLVPYAGGVFDVCFIAPLFKLPFQGKALRKKLGSG